MKKNGVDFSVIIPQRDSIHTLPRLFNSIPASDRIEVILVDNSPTPVTKEEIGIEREYTLLWAAPGRYAGGARNVGIENAHGKWLLFADADDFYTEGAFDVFYNNFNSPADVVYYGVYSEFIDTGRYSTRGERYIKTIRKFLSGECDEYELRLTFTPPWAKMVRKSYVDEHSFRFDEVIALNDKYFTLLIGYYAKKIAAVDEIVYVYTVNRGSLTLRRSFEMTESRYRVELRYNRFLREKGLSDRQGIVADYLYSSVKYGVSNFLKFLWLAYKYRQNPFIGIGHWVSAIKRIRANRREYANYTVNG